jgi:hypothetical protein
MMPRAPGSFSALLAPFSSRERLVLAGGALAIAGALLLIGTDGLNANGTPGPVVVVLLGAAIVVASLVLRRGRADIVIALAAGVLLVAIIEAIPPVRYSADLDAFGGIVGAVARAVALAGSVALLVGLAWPPVPSRILRLDSPMGRLPMLLLLIGSGLLIVGWLALVGVGVGFAPRLIDGLGIVAACLAVASARTGAVEGPAAVRVALRSAPAALAVSAALVTIGSVVAIGDRFGGLFASGLISVLGYGIYLASAAPFLVVAALAARPLMGLLSRAQTPSQAPTAPS